MQSGVTHVEVKALHRLGWTVSAIAREFDLSRTTVYKELASPAPRTYGPRAKVLLLNEAQLAFVQRRLAACAEIRGTDLHAELRHQYGYDGSYPEAQSSSRQTAASATGVRSSPTASSPLRSQTVCSTALRWSTSAAAAIVCALIRTSLETLPEIGMLDKVPWGVVSTAWQSQKGRPI